MGVYPVKHGSGCRELEKCHSMCTSLQSSMEKKHHLVHYGKSQEHPRGNILCTSAGCKF